MRIHLPVFRLFVNIFFLAVLVLVLSSPVLLAGNVVSVSVPWSITGDSSKWSDKLNFSLQDATGGKQAVVLSFKPSTFGSNHFSSVLSVANVSSGAIQVGVKSFSPEVAQLYFEGEKQSLVLRPGEAASLDLFIYEGSFSGKVEFWLSAI